MRVILFTRLIAYSPGLESRLLMRQHSVQRHLTTGRLFVSQMPPKGSGLSAAEREAEVKAMVAYLNDRFVSEKRAPCLPALPGHGLAQLPADCSGDWGTSVVAGLMSAANAVRVAQRRDEIAIATCIVRTGTVDITSSSHRERPKRPKPSNLASGK